MRHPALDSLLILQDRDSKRRGIEQQLKAIPADIAAVEKKIADEKAAIEAARTELRELESQKKLLETEIGSAEQTLARYKTQQVTVRKNDEYQALGQQIAATEEAISALEEKELAVMYAIDEAKKRFAAAEAVLKENIAGHEARIRTHRERAASLEAELAQAQEAFAQARTAVDEPSLRVYDRVAARQTPVIVAIRGGKCSGCHLKISGEVDSVARKGEKLATCDQCGRIVWLED
jgi:Zn-ribbon protein, possibly nucleic acid-binding